MPLMIATLLSLLAVGATALEVESNWFLPLTATQVTTRCLAIGLPSVQGVEGNAADVGGAVRELFVGFLTGPSAQVIQLEAKLASQALAEARERGCRHVLTASLTRQRSSGSRLGRMLGQAGATAAWTMPGGNATAAVVRGVAVASAQAISEIASSTRARDEMTLVYRFDTIDGHVVLQPTDEKLRAAVDGEDLLTPLVRRASESIVAAVADRR
jgi:hypothetical protein